jgi:hypothetical protein
MQFAVTGSRFMTDWLLLRDRRTLCGRLVEMFRLHTEIIDCSVSHLWWKGDIVPNWTAFLIFFERSAVKLSRDVL